MPNPEPGGEAGRVRCLYCGANNFPGTAVCWQCGRPLKAIPEGADAPGSSAAPMPAAAQMFAPAARPSVMESPLAPKAAAALGLMFPYVGLPVGMVFLMLDDPRKEKLGWMTIGWSVVGTILNGIALLITLLPLWNLLKGAHPGGAPPGIPGMPSLNGDGAGLLLPSLLGLILTTLHV